MPERHAPLARKFLDRLLLFAVSLGREVLIIKHEVKLNQLLNP